MARVLLCWPLAHQSHTFVSGPRASHSGGSGVTYRRVWTASYRSPGVQSPRLSTLVRLWRQLVLAHIHRLLDRRVSVRVPAAAALVVVQVMLVLACVVAVRQITVLSERVEIYRKWTGPLVGRNVPPITGVDRRGDRRSIEYGKDPRPTLIYSFSQNCGACRANWAAMKGVQSLSPDRLRIIYVDLKETLTEEYLRDHGLAQEVLFAKLDPFSEVSYQVRATPQAELVDRSGRVIWTNLGAFRPTDLAALNSAIARHEEQSLAANQGGQ